eukprot:m.575629 g.575629  ORF g.575629 m.575629 type:complete len:190 (+) comp22285_c0_seq3:881-1450(+)
MAEMCSTICVSIAHQLLAFCPCACVRAFVLPLMCCYCLMIFFADNEENFYAEKELVPQRFATASQLPKKVKGVPQPLRHKTYGEIVYGDLSRQEAVDKLTKAAQGAKNGGDGCFLLRASASVIDGVVVSIYAEQSVNHFQFHHGSDGTYRNSKGKVVGAGLVELIEYYQKHKEGLPSTLKIQLLPPSTR